MSLYLSDSSNFGYKIKGKIKKIESYSERSSNYIIKLCKTANKRIVSYFSTLSNESTRKNDSVNERTVQYTLPIYHTYVIQTKKAHKDPSPPINFTEANP